MALDAEMLYLRAKCIEDVNNLYFTRRINFHFLWTENSPHEVQSIESNFGLIFGCMIME